MPNGKPRDHPVTDVVVYGMPVFSPEVDELIREIDTLGGRAELWALTDAMMEAERQLGGLRVQLRKIRDRLRDGPPVG